MSQPAGSSQAEGSSSQMPLIHPSTAGSAPAKKKRKNHRAGKKRKGKRTQEENPLDRTRPSQSGGDRPPFYRAYQSDNLNLSGTSLDSDALLDHREHTPMRPRRDSRAALSSTVTSSFFRRRGSRPSGEPEDEVRTPLLSTSGRHLGPNYGGVKSSASSTTSSKRHKPSTSASQPHDYDVNNPPSRPASPVLGESTFGDVLEGEFGSPVERRQDFVIDIDGDESPSRLERRHTIAGDPEGDVCFPVPDMSDIDPSEAADFEYQQTEEEPERPRRRRRRWPDLDELEDWAQEEKEQMLTEGLRARKVREPEYVGGRLRPRRQQWHREPEDAPYRFTYFNGLYGETIHARTISDLRQEGQTFKDLFLPDPVELSSDEEEDEDDDYGQDYGRTLQGRASRDFSVARSELSPGARSRAGTRQSSILEAQLNPPRSVQGKDASGELTPVNEAPEVLPPSAQEPKRYGERPTFWLDVLCPTEAEMKVLSRTFGLHMLTSEDILTQESREKVELFRHYYFIHYRTFEQDTTSENYMDPVNMYIVVFREGVITFHFSLTPHPANVRRRIRQLKDYLVLNPDWLSYALIDDITDAYQPVIESIEERVDEIDDAILEMHGGDESDHEQRRASVDEKASIKSEEPEESGTHMLRRVGRIRKKVMKLGRLLGTKADVIKGFAKRCNEQWEIAPRSDIGMFLGDIQDHILTMQSSLSHYEMLLSRAHSNYLAQINIRMNERQEETSGSLNKLTVLGTIVLPMNIITGMWGMNVKVPGQEVDNLDWFFSITAGLFLFGFFCWMLARWTSLA